MSKICLQPVFVRRPGHTAVHRTINAFSAAGLLAHGAQTIPKQAGASGPIAYNVVMYDKLNGGAMTHPKPPRLVGRGIKVAPPVGIGQLEPVHPIAVRNLHGQVVQALGRLIVNGKLAPGESLPREELLAQRMHVSRTALREGMKVLAAKGLIESRQKTGARVRETVHWDHLDADVLAWRCESMPTEDFVEKLVEMRGVIEPAAAATAARRRSDLQLRRIAAAFNAMEAASNLDAWAAADLAFHEGVLHATNNELMISLFSVVETALGTYFVLSARTAGNFSYSLPYHKKVLDAIRRRQPEAARRAMNKMVADSRANILRHAKKGMTRWTA